MLHEPSPTSLPNPELRERRDEFERLANAFSKLARGLTPEQWQWTPLPDAWSVGQIMDHLNTVHDMMLPPMLEAIRQGHADAILRPGPFRYSLIERGVIWSFGPNAPIRQQAPAPFRPGPEASPLGEALTRFADLQFRLMRLTEDANGLDLAHIKITSLVWPRLRISLGAWFQALVAHQENHLAQAQAVITSPGYPPAPG